MFLSTHPFSSLELTVRICKVKLLNGLIRGEELFLMPNTENDHVIMVEIKK